MSLIVVNLDPAIPIRSANWQQSGGVIYNRSEFTGKTQALRIGPASRWTCELQPAPQTESAAGTVSLRAFYAAAARGDFAIRVPFFDTAQTATATCLSNGANQLGFLIAVDGLPVSASVLASGQIVTFQFAADNEQSCVLLSNVTSNGSGQATLSLATPVRQPVADNTTIRLATPGCLMRVRNGPAWGVVPGLIHDVPALQMEEVF